MCQMLAKVSQRVNVYVENSKIVRLANFSVCRARLRAIVILVYAAAQDL